MRKKLASLEFFEIAEKSYNEIQNISESEKKAAKVMVVCQNYFYSGECGVKYILNLGNFSINREDILLELRTYNGNFLSETELEELINLYLSLLPKSAGGTGFRNMGGYQGKYNPSDIYEAHRDFAKFVVQLLKNEK